ncbi:amino acid adenylation domain-containing protein [Teredinibacter haidensis]|uniref:amino acid adenylation domain-containing protein n=1 Tax=Teredinibacter haidensis TaxID=2731755 RepID=UPI000948AB58|nr:amino acid adenylation domain-containing protein [Teredinibacter haidensis]
MYNKIESLQAINNTDDNSFMNLKLNDLIEEQVARTPDAEAVCYEGARLSFNSLNARANQLARQLRDYDVDRNNIVAVVMDRSLELAVGLLGILKSGGAYLPLDPETPQDRLDFILQDANVSVVLTQQKHSILLRNFSGKTLSLDADSSSLTHYNTENLSNINQAEDLAYIIYTSGSTGKPKGCMLPHRAICNRLLWMKQQYQVSSRDRILQKTPYTFDVSVWELFLPMLSGASLVFAKPKGHKDNAYLISLIQQENITICHFVPSMLRFFLNQPTAAQCESLKHVFASGEALSYELTTKFIETMPSKLHNLYGPTEAAVDVSYWECELREDQKVPIGRPISNIQLFILDENFAPVAPGESGELYIGGVGLAKGYLNRDEITAKAFINNPLPTQLSRSPQLYRTGDEACLLADGNIEYLGRLDSQVKLRGFRIELGEIENSINQHKDIEHSVVLVKGEGTINPELVAFIVSRQTISLKQIRGFLRTSLPDYMLPNAVVHVDEIPVTTHGKVDRKALLQLTQKQEKGEGAKAQITHTPQEQSESVSSQRKQKLVVELRSDFLSLLDIDVLEVDEDLFELGATSFTMVQMVEKIQDRHDINIPVEVFLDSPTVSAIADYLETSLSTRDQQPVVEAPDKPITPSSTPAQSIDTLSSTLQKYFIDLLDARDIGFNDDLFEHGATSFTMVQVVENIQNDYGTTIPVEVFLDTPTMRAIAAYLFGVLSAGTEQTAQNESSSSEAGFQYSLDNSEIESMLLQHFSELLDTHELTVHEDLFECGATSFTMVQVVERVQNDLSITIPVEIFLDSPSVEAIAKYVAELMPNNSNSAATSLVLNPENHTAPGRSSSEVDTFEALSLNALHAQVLTYFTELLDSADITVDDDLFEHGATSFTMVQVVEKIQEELLVMVPVEVFLDNPTVDAISLYLQNELAKTKTDNASLTTVSNTQRDSKSPSIINSSAASSSIQMEFQTAASNAARIKLKDSDFIDSAYIGSSMAQTTPEESSSLDRLGEFLSLLRQEKVDQEGKYLYASAGGLNPVQTYVYIKDSAIEGLTQGIYYYHPKNHSLFPVSSGTNIEQSVFFEFDHKTFKNSSFAIFFIAQMKSLLPIYKDTSATLSVLEAGYMGQLLASRQEDFGLALSPISSIKFNAISQYFDLDENHAFIHCMLAENLSTDNSQQQNVTDKNLFEYLCQTNKSIQSQANPLNHPSMTALLHETARFPTKEEKENIQNDPNLRRLPTNRSGISLKKKEFPGQYYKLRSTKREYIQSAVPFENLSKFLSLLDPKTIGNSHQYLYASVTASHSLKVFVYVKENGVEGLSKGLYQYYAQQHKLALVTSELSSELKSCYTPFNRKQLKASKFCVFLVSPEKDLKPYFDNESRYLALLDAGYIGQLLMDRQAEFEIGVCPIGGILFDKIRDDFHLEDGDQLVHSLVCGGYEMEMPADWKFLENRRQPNNDGLEEHATQPQHEQTVNLRQDIAIVGISGRFPGAETLDQFWKNLEQGRESFKELSFEREEEYRRSDLPEVSSPNISHKAAFLDQIDCFDSRLFNISPLEARSIDPQERLLLEVVWECLENSGYTGQELNRASQRIGVFVGAMWDDYQHHSSNNEKADQNVPVISLHSSIANNISQFFQFNGPSIALNTSCSSAMTAIHYACTSIKNLECRAAVVGGANIMSHPYHHRTLEGLDLLSKDGRSNPFGKNGSGFVVGEGVGAILIKPLADAERDGDYIHGVIKGSAVGFSGRGVGGGSSKPKLQKESILTAIENSGIDASSISYIETAAPGASLADATEITALKDAFGVDSSEHSRIFIGSVKSNIGHLESASAMSQLMKVLLQLKHKIIFPTVNVGTVSPLIQLKDSGLEISQKLMPWEPTKQQVAEKRNGGSAHQTTSEPRRALINAFGATGSGGHVVIEEYTNHCKQEQAGDQLILLSAATEAQLVQLAQRLLQYLKQSTNVSPLSDIAHTLRMGRTEMLERVAMVVKSHQELAQMLQNFIEGTEHRTGMYRGTAKSASDAKHLEKQTNLGLLAQDWVRGVKFSWQGLTPTKSKRAPLPTYPFAKERHWIKKENNVIDQHASMTGTYDGAFNGTPHLTSSSDSVANTENDQLLSDVSEYLKDIISEVSEIPASQIDSTSTFDHYGINSFMITKLNFALEKDFGELSKTLFFEYQTIHQLSQYFLNQHTKQVNKLLGVNASATSDIAHDNRQQMANIRQANELSMLEQRPYRVADIAIVGLSGKFPQSDSIDAYWDNLKSATDCVSEIPLDRWDYRDYYEEDKTIPGKIHSKWGGFISGIDEFDPLFFNISPREAEFMDPQERLFLQTVWHTFEDAGYAPSSKEIARHKIGVFVGVMYGEYQLFSGATNRISNSMAVGASYGTIANRVSYILNLTGPSMAIDTLCSSSLTALHIAVNSIKNGECEAAVVGGVNLSIHPNKYIMQAQGNMSSSEGRCRSFGEGGDGFVASEGVGAMFIKPLRQSIADGDNIYAVIKGTAINNDGKTHGYTVPNPNAHAEMIVDALQTANINPECISYVEAHGTGTSLGDPIEITGLTKAFGTFTPKTAFCAIGSAKSNIGHTEAAAGIAGISKILMQMKHKTLVPSLHSKQLNPNINFDKSPFYVQQQLTPWKRPIVDINGQPQEYPRTACISSLGAGGSNAHAIIQEYVESESLESPEPSKVIIPLSAKNQDRLKEYAQSLIEFIQKNEANDNRINLSNLAFTLQTGREPLEERLGVVVSSTKELLEKLRGYLSSNKSNDKNNHKKLEGVYQGGINRDKNLLSVFTADEDMSLIVETWITKAKHHKIVDLWVKGLNIDWRRLYQNQKPKRISAPGYPFAKERYWVDNTLQKSGETSQFSSMHPLLHSNTSDLSEQRFTSTFSGGEFFLRDHVINGKKILPGVSYLEMARAAVVKSSGLAETDASIVLENIVWTQPIAVNDAPQDVHIGLAEAEDGRIHYEIYTESEKGEEIIHSQGTSSIEVEDDEELRPTRIDISEIQSQMTQGILDAETCYTAFSEMGINYGEAHQAIEKIFKGDQQLLAKLSLPVTMHESTSEYTLHPSLMDSAIQSSIGLMIEAELKEKGASEQHSETNSDKPQLTARLPFALESLLVKSACTSEMFAWVRPSSHTSAHSPAKQKIQKLDIDLYDEHGVLCVSMRGFSSRVLDTNSDPAGLGESTNHIASGNPEHSTLLTTPSWVEATVSSSNSQTSYGKHLILMCEPEDSQAQALGNLLPSSNCHALVANAATASTIASQYTEYAAQCFEHLQVLLRDKSQEKAFVQIVIPDQPEHSVYFGLSSLLKTAALENPRIAGQVIQIDTNQATERLAKLLKENLSHPTDSCVKYENQKRYVLHREEFTPDKTLADSHFKEEGIYLITGGLGAIGQQFAREILKQTNNVTLVLTGRSQLDQQKQSVLTELEILGGRVEYYSLDVSEPSEIKHLLSTIQQSHRALDGVIHCAGVIADNFILKKTKQEFEQVLAAKVTGTINLHTATSDMSLDFFVLFSSTSAILGNYGQADYATANAFMDHFASYRSAEMLKQNRQGRTLSINWPLWKDGGMQIDAASEAMMIESTGMIPMQTETGLRAFYQGLSSGHAQVSVAEGQLEKLHSTLLGSKTIGNELQQDTAPSSVIDAKTLEEKAQQYLKKQFSSVLKLSMQKIDTEAPLEQYGMDSILAINLTNQLEKTFGSLPKTLFFEYQTISELSNYFLQSYEATLQSLYNSNATSSFMAASSKSAAEPVIKTAKLNNRKRRRFTATQQVNHHTSKNTALDIAIVGLSGRYPQSRNLQEYWEKLQSGVDCITEIPEERWDWQDYYTEDRSKNGMHYSKWGGFIEGVDEFDPLFFNITPIEAMAMDPQERLFLQHAWMAIEDAGYTRETLHSVQHDDLVAQIGVYAGVMYSEYQLFGAEESLRGNRRAIAGSLASIANRVSYVLNLHGPSMTIDTMCSSSLTSIHLACQDLKHRKTDIGIAGGVNVTIHPNKYLGLSATGFISAKGRCESFGEGGEGYIPGEGVGVVLLKRLEDAVKDEDHIYGVILGSAINHGGKTNGYTVPNPKAQRSVIEMALSEAKITPDSISYIEAHGTGTKLGDPIEIAALSQAFGKHTNEKGFCRIGSTKSNIGHCEGAAGIAGLTKILLQMKHRKIVPSLHSSVLNSNIDFPQTPFIVNQELNDWQPTKQDNTNIPLVAAVSSFGAGGSNAHLIVTEYQDVTPAIQQSVFTPVVIPLSARTQDQLVMSAQNLLDFISHERSNNRSGAQLENIAYTLQTGREAMEERLGLIVSSVDELCEKLKAYINGEQDIDEVYQGQVKRNKEALAVFAGDEELQEAIEKWIERKKISKLVDLWVKGFRLDWNRLYTEFKPRRISLPSYPFAKEKYWYSETPATGLMSHAGSNVSTIHPLLHQNTSDLLEQRFTSRFTGAEFFINRTAISGERLLSTAAHLEMARAAVCVASRRQGHESAVKLSEMSWGQPALIEDPSIDTHIGLYEENDGRLHYEIYSETDDPESPVVHFKGCAEFHSDEQPASINISLLQSQMVHGPLTKEAYNAIFHEMGFELNDKLQTIQEIYQGDRELLAKLCLPASLVSTKEDYELHPAIVNAAIRSSVGLWIKDGALATELNLAHVDFLANLASLSIKGGCYEEMYAWVRFSKADKTKQNSGSPICVDIDIYSSVGVPCIELRGIEFDNTGVSHAVTDGRVESKERRMTFLKKMWTPSELQAKNNSPGSIIVLHNVETKALADIIQATAEHARLIPEYELEHTEFTESVEDCDVWMDLTGIAGDTLHNKTGNKWISLLQTVIEKNRTNNVRLLYVTQGLELHKNTSIELSGATRVGLYRMLQSEYSGLSSRHLDLDPNAHQLEQLANAILTESASHSREVECCYRNESRFISQLHETTLRNTSSRFTNFNDSDVVLVTGGTRGVGLLCAQHLVATYGLKRLILTGREKLPEQNEWSSLEKFPISVQDKIRKIQMLQQKGVEVKVIPFPLHNPLELKKQYDAAQVSDGNIVGVIHAAGLADGENPAFIRKTEESIARVMSPKVDGLQNLMQLVDINQLRFTLLFSSVSALIPRLGTGQSDYAMANAYMDYYVMAQGSAPIVSIQWPSWKETGMGEATGAIYNNTGLLTITDNEGRELLDQVLANLHDSVIMPLVVDDTKFNAIELMQSDVQTSSTDSAPVPVIAKQFAKTLESETLKDNERQIVDAWLQSIFESELKLNPGQIDASSVFADYGVDSILLAQLLKRLNRELSLDLEPSILLEHSSLDALSLWLQNNYLDVLAQHLPLNSAASSNAADSQRRNDNAAEKTNTVAAAIAKSRTTLNTIASSMKRPSRARNTRNSAEQIAVVGMACRFPGASNIEEYWDLLFRGESAIAAIPEDCWGVKTDYYGGLLDNIYGFDPKFFMIPNEDAQAMDPQALVLLEESLNVIYHAGYTHQELAGKDVGVYIGARSQSADPSQIEKSRNPIMIVGQNYLAANISQFFNLRGPSLVLDTACSSSLVAMNMAVEAMRSGTIESALVGGVSLLTSPSAHEMFSKRNLLQAEGQFHIMDQRASGIVLGEGCGMVYLKPLEKAKQDGDSIYAVIAGIGINNDGRTAGPATPNMEAQAAVMKSALKQSQCSIDDVGYLDVNGSGSEVTDLLEIKAVASVYKREATSPMYLGAMKPNIGHPLCAEGIASFIKVALMLNRQQLVPFLSGQKPLKHYAIEQSGFSFPRQAESKELKYAALNCFADGGTNAHVILQQDALQATTVNRKPLPSPALQRVDVRTFEPLITESKSFYNSELGFLSHDFGRSKEWGLTLTSDHPILANHKVYDQDLLPGLAWIDFLYQWFAEAGNSFKTLALKNLAIYRPLIVAKAKPVNLLVEATETNEGVWRIQVRDSLDTISEDDKKSLYITAEMHSVSSPLVDERVHIQDIASSQYAKTDIDEIYQHCQSRELIHSDIMKVKGSVYDAGDAIWVHVKLDGSSPNSVHHYQFHPALVDGSGVGTESLFSGFAENEDRLFLPLFYESFIASECFGNECYTRIKKSSVEVKEELLSISMEFFSPDGRKIGELKNFKNKLVRNEGLINPGRQIQHTDAPRTEATKPKASQHVDLSFSSMSSLVQSIVASKLEVDTQDIAVDRGYYELGLNSIVLLEVSKLLESILATSLSPTLLFEYTTIAALAEFLENNYELPRMSDSVKSLQSVYNNDLTDHKENVVVSCGNEAAPKDSEPLADTTHSRFLPQEVTETKNVVEIEKPLTTDIAVIGMSGRYPHAANIAEFWENLKEGKDCVTEIPEDRWDINYFDGLTFPSGKSISKWGGFIEDPYCFDNKFFRITAKEAETLDPQERLFLEVCWESMEDAGYTPENIVSPEGSNHRRPVGVFVGVMHKDYSYMQNEAVYEGQRIPLTLNDASIANRISYLCNFHGPSMAVDTMCSSSLTAVHLAMESLHRGESKIALAGGVNLSLHPNKYLTYGIADIHGSDNHCHTFGEGGDGYVSAEGVGAILLKPLQQAVADGDSVYAVLKGSTINHGGTNGGFTIPSPIAQGEMIADCLEKTGIDPATITYIEAHGTGTSLGDPIEIQGLNRAFREHTDKKQYCALGSVKSNMGHAEGAAGISGLTKTILQLHHKTLVKSLHSEVINPYLDLASSPFYVQRETEKWELSETSIRRAGISSFGATGSNAHIILEEFTSPEIDARPSQSRVEGGVLLPISAKNHQSLHEYAKRMLSYLEGHPQTDLMSLAYTLQTGRVEMEERLILCVTSVEQTIHQLRNWLVSNPYSQDDVSSLDVNISN